MKISSIEYRAICHATEDIDAVKKAVENAGCTGEHQISYLSGLHQNRIVVISGRIEKQKEVKALLSNLESHGIMKAIENQIEDRLDDDCVLHIRLSKQDAFNNKIVLAGEADCIQISMHIWVHPARKEKAMSELRKYYENIHENQYDANP
ncbi:MAG: RNA-binding domain-containing protein [Thermoplasmata archaeon]